jgi:hypothetical protein
MKKCLLLLFLAAALSSLNAQDTIVVQTLTWQDEGRSGFYEFPDDPNLSFRKIIMRYNMRCHDNAIGNGNVGCREWDYSCNTFITDPSLVDSTRATHPDYVIPGYSGAEFPYTAQDVYTYQQYLQYDINYGMPSSSEVAALESTMDAPVVLNGNDGRLLLLYSAEMLNAAGLTANTIDHLSFYVESPGPTTGFLRIRIQDYEASSFAANEMPPLAEGEEVYFRSTSFDSEGWVDLPIRPYDWDGMSSLLLELSYTSSPGSEGPALATFSQPEPVTLIAKGDNAHLEFNGYGAMVPPQETFQSVENEVTVSFWSYGNENVLPVNTTILEGVNADNQRHINVHLPWSNGQVYWDCGNDGGGYDRINKTANLSDFAGQWNHWAFTKNAATGSMKIYLNGTLWHSGTGNTKPIDVEAFAFGSNISGTTSYYGKVDELRIWNKELAEEQIRDWMHYELNASHPEYDALVAYYPFNEGTGTQAQDASANAYHGNLYNAPSWRWYRGVNLFNDFNAGQLLPAIRFTQSTYDEMPEEVTVTVLDSTLNTLYAVINYTVNGENDLVAVDTQYLWEANETFVYDAEGEVFETITVDAEGLIVPEELTYYLKREAKFELLSLVTPYGNGLSLGNDGKTFYFDVTDYAPILKGERFMSMEMGGQFQEEFDIQFLFITGVPPRDVIGIQNIWPFRRGWFAEILDDRYFEPRDVLLMPDAAQYKIRSAITGHGQNGEFTPRNHYINIDGGEQEFVYQVWKECGDIPIYPQGGTWLFDRAGWCPGMPTDVHEFSLDEYEPGQSIEIDYGLIGAQMSEANYLVSNQLVTYGPPNFQVDAAIEAIIRPSNRVEYERYNPMCSEPIIVVQNNGTLDITELTIAYGLEGGQSEEYTWTGTIAYLDSVEIRLPAPELSFWASAGETPTFYAELVSVNGGLEDYADNNIMYSEVQMPSVFEFEQLIQFHFLTNNRASENRYTIRDAAGNIMIERDNMENATLYKDDIVLPPGCYTLHIEDSGDDGLYYWYWDAIGVDVGSGSAQFKRIINDNIQLTVKGFESEFGRSVFFDFVLPATTSNESVEKAQRLSVYPNPASSLLNVELQGFEAQELQLQIFSLTGQLVLSEMIDHDGAEFMTTNVNVSQLPGGAYLLKVQGQDRVWSRELIKQ